MAISDQGLAWMEQRGVDPEIASRLGVAASDGEIVFPFLRDGQVVNHKYRKIATKDFRQDKGGEQCLWNQDVLLDQSLTGHPVVITEGEVDAITAIQAGWPCAVSVPGGASLTPQGEDHYHYIQAVRPLLADRTIILATDDDEPGRMLHNDLLRILGRARVKWVRYPDGTKDLNDVLQWYGQGGVTEALTGAQWVEVKGVYKMSDLPPLPSPKALTTGLRCLDPHFKVRRGDFVVVTGIPGQGKTTFVNELCCRLAKTHGWRIAMGSFEQPPQTEHKRFLLSHFYGQPAWRVHDQREGLAWIDDHFTFLYPGVEDLTDLRWVIEMMGVAVARNGCQLVVIDPWNELDHDKPQGMPMTEYVNIAIKELRLAARRLNVALIVVAHPTKLGKDDAKHLGLYHISDSAAWANKADVGIVVSREPNTEMNKIAVKKTRYHDQIGVPGEVSIYYDSAAHRYREPDDMEPMI